MDAKGSWSGMDRGAGLEESEERLRAHGVMFEPRLQEVFQCRAFEVAAAAAAKRGGGEKDVDVFEEGEDVGGDGEDGLEGLAMGRKRSSHSNPGDGGKGRRGAVPSVASASASGSDGPDKGQAGRGSGQGARPPHAAGSDLQEEAPGEELVVEFRLVFPTLAVAKVVHAAVSVDPELRPELILREAVARVDEKGVPEIAVSLKSTDPKFLKSASISFIELLCLSASIATAFTLKGEGPA